MNLADCYRLLGLRFGASSQEIKASYRRLARQYHPDVNPDDYQAKEKFIALSEAYQLLLQFAQSAESHPKKAKLVSDPVVVHTSETSSSRQSVESSWAASPPRPKIKVQVRQEAPSVVFTDLSQAEQQLKRTAFLQLQDLLKQQRFLRAIALAEGIAQRLPQDVEVKQWQAIAYQRYGRQLIAQRQIEKARIYLKKALRTDPHNRSLWAEVEQDFRRIEQVY